MKLGSSLRRRRSREEGAGGATRLVLLGLAVVALGLAGGYLLATEALFPAPAPPDELGEVPDVHGLQRQEAEERIREVGFVLAEVDSVGHPVLPAGAVVGQSPIPGQVAEAGDSVHLTVSLGPEERAVPDVFRVRGDRARAVLEATGFRVEVDSVDSEQPRGRVVDLEPEPGTEVTLPGEVRLTVSLGPSRVQMPLLLGMPEADALDRLDALGLSVAEVATRFRFGLDQGIVIEQEPDAGTMLERGTAVRLVVGTRGGSAGNIPPPGSVEPPGISGNPPRENARFQ